MSTTQALAEVTVASFEPGEAFARHLDAIDPLAGHRRHFAIPPAPGGGDSIYLCGNSLGLMPRATRELLGRELDDWARLDVEGHRDAATP